MNRIVLAIPATGAYRKWAEVTALSACDGCSLPIEVKILDWAEIEQAGVSRAKLEGLGSWHGSAITYAKMYMTELLPQTDRVIVCDADVLFRGDLASLWKLGEEQFDGKVWLLPSRDSQPPWRTWNPEDAAWFATQGLAIKHPENYFCAGFMMMDLKAMRDGGWPRLRDEFLARYDMRTIPFGEQGVMNYLLQDHLRILPRQWGCFSGDTNDDVDYNGDCAIHYISDAPWERKGPTRLMSDAVVLWRKAAGMPTGGWRRWLWCALRATAPLWRWEPHFAWHFRTALKRQKPKVAVNGMEVVRRLFEDAGLAREDEVWVHGMWLPRYWVQCLWAKVRGKKLVRMTHGSLDPVRLGYSEWKKRLVRPIEKMLFALAERVVVTGEHEERWCREWGIRNRIERVDLKRFFKFREVGEIDQTRALHVLYLGRRHPLKGVEYLEEAVKGMEGVELRVVSDAFGEEKERVWRWCDVLCLPTLSENFGLVVAEALERGKRVVTTDGAPAWRGQEGVVYIEGFVAASPEAKVDKLREAIIRARQSPNSRSDRSIP